MILLRVRNLTIDGHLSAQRLWIKEPRATNGEGDKESVQTHDSGHRETPAGAHISHRSGSRVARTGTYHVAPRGPSALGSSGLGRNYFLLSSHMPIRMPSWVIVTDNSHSAAIIHCKPPLCGTLGSQPFG